MTIDVTQHMGLVHMVARRYASAVRGRGGLGYDDLVQVGLLGAMRAAQTYDPALGAPSTYLVRGIRNFVRREIANRAEVVRLPVFMQQRRRKAGEPARAQCHSLNVPLGGGDGDDQRTHLDLLAAPEPGDARECLPDVSLEELLASTRELTDRERWVLRFRGLGHTLEAIGRELGVTRERARQLELLAIAKVRDAQGIAVDDEVQARIDRHEARLHRSARAQAARRRAA